MKKIAQTSLLLVFAGLVTSNLHAVQPLSENDMDSVSAETGQNIIDIFGPAGAGLADDSPDETPSEGEEAKAAANTVLEDNETIDASNAPSVQPTSLSFEEAEAAITANAKTVGNAQLLDTNSQIEYKTKDFHHEADFLKDGTVVHTRDLQVDLLKLENLSGDYDDNQNYGNIYLSDWESRGSTRMQER